MSLRFGDLPERWINEALTLVYSREITVVRYTTPTKRVFVADSTQCSTGSGYDPVPRPWKIRLYIGAEKVYEGC